MRDQTFDSTNAAPSPFSCATSLQTAATIRLSFMFSWIRVDNRHAQCEVNKNEHNLVPRYFESSMQNDMRLSFFISKRQINLKEYLLNAFPRGIEGDIEV